MRRLVVFALLLLTACDGGVAPDDGGTPTDAGVDDSCAADDADADCLCAPHVVPVDTPFEVIGYSECACEGTTPAHCDVVVENQRILVQTHADTCDSTCTLPSCTALSWTCDIPGLAAGTYVIESCEFDLCTERWVTVGDDDDAGAASTDAGVANCADTVLRADFSCR